jgi:hypothetical protein
MRRPWLTHSFINSFIPLTCAECDNSLPFSVASSVPLCYILFPATLLHPLLFLPPSLHLAIYFLVCILVFFIQNSYTILRREFCFIFFSVHFQTNLVCIALLSLLWYRKDHFICYQTRRCPVMNESCKETWKIGEL